MKRAMENKATGQRKVVKQGFSWTTLFFGIFVPLFRGDILWFIGAAIGSTITFGLFWLVFPFIYNGIYINKLHDKGYTFVN